MNDLRSKKILASALLFFIFCLCLPGTKAIATDYTISGTQTTQQNVVTNDTVTVTGTGDLDVEGAFAAAGISGILADNVTVTVQTGGKITSGAVVSGVETIVLRSGANVTVQSGATVKNTGFNGLAIRLVGSGGTLTNAGTLTSTNLSAAGIATVRIDASNSTITNNGTISANSSKEAVILGTGGTSTGNVLNLYGSAGVTGLLTNKGTAGGATVNFGYNGVTADGSANVTMTGNIASTDNIWNGRAYGGTSTVTGSAKFNDLQTDSGSTLSVSGGVNVKSTLTNAGTLTANVTHDTTDVLTLTNSGTITGTLRIDSGTVNNVGSSSINGGIDMNGGTLGLGSNTTLTVNNTTDFASGSVISTTFGSPPGKISNGSTNAAITLNDGVSFSLGRLPTSVSSNDTYTLVDATGAGGGSNLTVTPANISLSYESLRYTLALSKSADKLLLTPSITQQSGLSSNSAKVNEQVDAAFQNDASMLSNINSITSAPVLDSALETLTPLDRAPVDAESINLYNESLGIVQNRINFLRGGLRPFGMSTGDSARKVGTWGQGFYTTSRQENIHGMKGYKSRNSGFALGADMQSEYRSWDALLGLVYSMGWARVDVNTVDDNTHINNYLFGGYSSFSKDNLFVDFAASYSLNRYEGERFTSVGSDNRIAESSYFGHQPALDAKVGYNIAFKGFSLKPTAGLQYTMLYTESFTEKNAGDANLSVKSSIFNRLTPKAGVSISRAFNKAKLRWKPELSTEYIYDVLNEEFSTDATFSGGGTSFASAGLKPERYKIRSGAGLDLNYKDKVSLGMNYNFYYNKSFESHNATIELRFEF